MSEFLEPTLVRGCLRLRAKSICYSLAVLLGIFLNHPLEARATDNQINWTANNSKVDGLPISIEALTIALHNLGILPTVSIDTEEFHGGTVEEFLRDRFPVYNWTQKIDNVVCDLNPDHCSRPRLNVDTTTLADISGHSSGFMLTPAEASRWKFSQRTAIVIPDLALRPRANWVDFVLPEGGDIRRIYETEGLGCVGAIHPTLKFDLTGSITDLRRNLVKLSEIDCPKYIAARQQVKWSVLTFKKKMATAKNEHGGTYDESIQAAYREGQSVLGNIYAASTADIAWSLLNEASHAVYRNLTDAPIVSLPVVSVAATIDNMKLTPLYLDSGKERSRVAGSPSWTRFYTVLTPVDRFDYLSKGLSVDEVGRIEKLEGGADGFVAAFGVDMDDTIVGKQRKTLFDPMNFDLTKTFSPSPYPHAIIFMDDSLDTSRCVFSSARPCVPRWLDMSVIEATSGPFRGDGEKLRAEHEKLKEGIGHGTGVAAVAVAQPTNGAMAGIDPLAVPLHYPFDFRTWETSGFKEKVEKYLNDLRKPTQPPRGFLVWNLSGHTLTRNFARPVDNYLKRFDVKKLAPESDFFVFAAGNEKKGTFKSHLETKECLSYPACWSPLYKNVVTVVGAMLDSEGHPTLWTSADGDSETYANPKFEIAAMAQGIVIPSQSVDGFFEVEGTSYAAPQVAAVIAMLRSSLISPPELVEARLIACGQMSKTLSGFVAGGLMDVQCSLQTRKTQVAFVPLVAGEVTVSEAKKLRPAQLKAVWDKSGKSATHIEFKLHDADGVSGKVRVWPELFKDSLVGYRQLVDDDGKYKIVTLNKRLEVTSEVREKIEEPILIEVLFDGDEKTTCLEFSQIISYIPAIPEETGGDDDSIPANDSSCVFNGVD
ncbi:S8/S53 family peptidase [Rhizobium leguminosarum]|uniref:S8/S53 family peptidase n=1 Tax=Rhizobium leguminosarum TaxID=384 RepID=UPI003F95AA5C